MDVAAASDEALMRRFAAGEVSAFEQLYRRYELRVFRYLQRNVRNHALAEDLLQEIWFAVARAAGAYHSEARFRAWLFSIAHNRMIDALRSTRTEVSLDLIANQPAEHLESSFVAHVAGPHVAAVADEQLAALLRALAELPHEQREAFLLQQEADLSVAEIAAVTHCNPETAKSRLRYARVKLRELLREVA